jgi:uncharacterized protein YbjT (DUF2867 family)
MTILVTGATELVGARLIPRLVAAAWNAARLCEAREISPMARLRYRATFSILNL